MRDFCKHASIVFNSAVCDFQIARFDFDADTVALHSISGEWDCPAAAKRVDDYFARLRPPIDEPIHVNK